MSDEETQANKQMQSKKYKTRKSQSERRQKK
jgi:hypothetical protein